MSIISRRARGVRRKLKLISKDRLEGPRSGDPDEYISEPKGSLE